MPILNSDHLFDQADRLLAPPPAGPPRQVDLRRAISSAYYGLFHFVVTSLADEFVGRTLRRTGPYALVYRGLDHRTLRKVCAEVQKSTLSQKYAPYVPRTGFGGNLQAFATAVIELQEKRHRADYNPQPRFLTSDAELAVAAARSAIRRYGMVSGTQKKAFLTLLLSPPR